ncbi:MAG: alpha/beta fold hydrolase [archaeon]
MKSVKKTSLVKIWTEVKKYLILRKKFFYFLIALIVIGVLGLFGTKIFLILNLLIGNDSLVKLTASDQDLFLSNSESVDIVFDTYVSANPFCKSVCDYVFKDLSTGEVLDKDSFYTIISNPTSKEYTVYAPEKGAGQKLYRFSVSCLSNESYFCQTEGEAIKKSYLVSLNYDLSLEQSELREKAIKKLNDSIEEFFNLNVLCSENKYLHGLLENKTLVGNLSEINLSSLEFSINESLSEFENYDYDFVSGRIINFSNGTLVAENGLLRAEIGKYNDLVFSVKNFESKLRGLVLEANMGSDNATSISILIRDYNDFVASLNSSFDLKNKTIEIGILNFRIDELVSGLDALSENNFVFENIDSSLIAPIVINFSSDYKNHLFIGQEKLICNYDGVSESCCDETCSSNSSEYPVILLHGHSFNSAISAEKSLGDLKGIQESLFADGFLDGGDFVLRSGEGLETFRKTQKQIVFSASYYFDIYENTEETVVLETQSDNLDSYALRLNEIINEVRAETGKNKVVIVAHSMGGLVSRKYLQIFGEEDVAELIMIGTPNHGIDGTVLSGCSILGESKHCADMDAKSLFLNKLNYGKVPSIPVENIIGLGCDMGGVDGDGVVKNFSAYLSWADNYYVNGTCESLDYLHGKLVKPDKMPEVYELVRGFL